MPNALPIFNVIISVLAEGGRREEAMHPSQSCTPYSPYEPAVLDPIVLANVLRIPKPEQE